MFPWPLESRQTVQAPCFVIFGLSRHYFVWIIVQILGPLLTMKVMMPVLSLSCLSFIVAVYSQQLTLSVPIHSADFYIIHLQNSKPFMTHPCYLLLPLWQDPLKAREGEERNSFQRNMNAHANCQHFTREGLTVIWLWTLNR